MTRFKYHRLKNAMLIGNGLANLVGVQIVDIISRLSIVKLQPDTQAMAERIDAVYVPVSFSLIGLITYLYERPIRRLLGDIYHSRATEARLALKARQRLLNEPFFLIGVNMTCWLTASIVYPSILHATGSLHIPLARIFIQTNLVGLTTCIVAFFILEHVLQKRLAQHVFPHGGLASLPNTLRIKIRTRLGAMLFACNLIPFIAVLAILSGTYRLNTDAEQLLDMLRTSLLTNTLIFMVTGVFVTILVTSNLTQPFREIVAVLQGIRNGTLNRKVRVTTSDEIGYTGDVINEMTEGLQERDKMRQSLALAREIQQSLLPNQAPCFNGLDIAGRSIYCDQTGGDYFDFFDLSRREDGSVGLVVGDVAGHGVSSALLMATVRAFLRLRSYLPGSLAEVVGDVNRQLAADVGRSGQFMTLYYMVINPAKRSLRWVRAGHDAAILYDPQQDHFEELFGTGLALGVDETFEYVEAAKNGLREGQVIVIGTDGIWEAHDRHGRMFGKKALYDIIRERHTSPAAEIVDAVIEALNRFQNDYQSEDDVTLVVIRLSGPLDRSQQ